MDDFTGRTQIDQERVPHAAATSGPSACAPSSQTDAGPVPNPFGNKVPLLCHAWKRHGRWEGVARFRIADEPFTHEVCTPTAAHDTRVQCINSLLSLIKSYDPFEEARRQIWLFRLLREAERYAEPRDVTLRDTEHEACLTWRSAPAGQRKFLKSQYVALNAVCLRESNRWYNSARGRQYRAIVASAYKFFDENCLDPRFFRAWHDRGGSWDFCPWARGYSVVQDLIDNGCGVLKRWQACPPSTPDPLLFGLTAAMLIMGRRGAQ